MIFTSGFTEKAYKDVPDNQDEVVLTDSEDDSLDPFNQSLEPVFRKECSNRSKTVQPDNETVIKQNNETISKYDDDKQTISEDEDSELDNSTDTIKQDDEDSKNSDYATGDESDVKDIITEARDAVNFTNIIDDKNDSTDVINRNIESRIDDQSFAESKNVTEEFVDANKSDIRGTYFVPDIEQQDNGPNESVEVKNQVRGTYFVRTSALDSSTEEDEAVNTEENEQATDFPETEKARGTYFVRASAIDTSVDEEMQEVVEHKSLIEENGGNATPEVKKDDAEKIQPLSEMLVSKIIKSLKKSTLGNKSDSSLRQFEQLEKASEDCGNDSADRSAFGDIKILKEKRTYFDENTKGADKLHVTSKTDKCETFISSNKTKDSSDGKNVEKEKGDAIPCDNLEVNMHVEEIKTKADDVLVPKPIPEKRTYFDNIHVQIHKTLSSKIVTDLKTSCRKNNERSPSIVSDDLDNPFEPSTMKKLLGENTAKLEVLSSIHTNKPIAKKHNSIDVFEGFESPQVRPKVIATPTTKMSSNLDEVRKSIEKLVLEQKTRNDIKQEAKLESISSVEEEPITCTEEPPTVKKAHKLEECVNIVVTGATPKDLNETQSNKDNTMEEFENIYKDLSTHRPTEFDLLTTTSIHDDNENDGGKPETDTNEDKRKLTKINNENVQKKVDDTKACESKEEVKYNLRHKGKSVLNVSDENKSKGDDEVLLESSSNCESKTKYNKRNLRLRRRKNDEDSDQDTVKLKDILNLKKEFSDVTLGLPACKKEVKDIPSPEKLPGEDENLPPLMGIQSCPSKRYYKIHYTQLLAFVKRRCRYVTVGFVSHSIGYFNSLASRT